MVSVRAWRARQLGCLAVARIGRIQGVQLLLRSLAVQGSWNYRTLQGAGVAYALLPVLSRLHEGDGATLARSVGRHTDFFNAHPYFATIAIGALARMETEEIDEEEISHFKRALIGPLGTLGDRLIWARWRPFCLLLAILIFFAGAPWWVVSAAFLLLYNVLHFGLRIWGLRVGWQQGRDVARVLLSSPLRRLPDRLTIPLAAVSGAVLPPVALLIGAGAGVSPLAIISTALPLAVVGYWRPVLVGRLAVAGLIVGASVLAAFGQVLS